LKRLLECAEAAHAHLEARHKHLLLRAGAEPTGLQRTLQLIQVDLIVRRYVTRQCIKLRRKKKQPTQKQQQQHQQQQHQQQ
jgi:hypothetical protein